MSTPHSCGHSSAFINAKVASESLARWTEPGRSMFEVAECPKCGWFLIVKKKAAPPPAAA